MEQATHPDGYRTAPSAGALYPLELYLVVGQVDGLTPGVYHYQADTHQLLRLSSQDVRRDLSSAALDQSYIHQAPGVIVITAVFQRTMKKYGQRGRRYVHMEVGHAAQNIYLQAQARALGTVMVGAFGDQHVQSVLDLPDDHEPLALMPIGHH